MTTPGRWAPEGPTRGRPARGRWIWGLSGLVTLTALAVVCASLIGRAGIPTGQPQQSAVSAPLTFTVRQPVTSLDVNSYGANIMVTGGPVSHVQVTEAITYSPPDAGPPAVNQSVSRGLLTLGAQACEQSDCTVGFTVTVPRDVAVTAWSEDGSIAVSGVAAADLDSGGGAVDVSDISRQLTVSSENGPLTVSRVANANLDSDGGNVRATDVRGPLTVNTGDGMLTLDGVSGSLVADTDGGNLLARDLSVATATVGTGNGSADMAFSAAPEMVSVDTGGGNAQLSFAAAPRSVTVDTDNGMALLALPAGPYAVTDDTDGGPAPVVVPGIVNDPTAPRSITVTTDGGGLQIQLATP
jgi:Putative adhesin